MTDLKEQTIKKVVIAGGGTAGWLAAAALTKKLGEVLEVSLVESDAIGTIGVGEATIPPLRAFHRLIGIDEQAFMKATSATFKLGISFENWGDRGERYFHSFGKTGKDAWLADFLHFWLRGKQAGIEEPFGAYCPEHVAAAQGKFATSKQSQINYAYHLDAGRYAAFLREYSEKLGLKRIEGKISAVHQDASTGFITSLALDNGKVVEGDLFIDCTGFRSLLLGQTLKVEYEQWGHWLPCDRAVAVQTSSLAGTMLPYTRSIARDAGWQWQIPLQHRVGNGMVFSSAYLSDEAAIASLLENVEGELLTEPRVIPFTTGRRRQSWDKNCVALGLSSGFLEPLESTSIHGFMTGVIRLMQLFPFGGIDQSLVDDYNQQTAIETEKIRDFIILHFHATRRSDSEFWRYCRDMTVPDSLAQRIALFRENALAFQRDGELFRVDSWNQVLLGQGIMPQSYHRLAKLMSDTEVKQFLTGISSQVQKVVQMLPSHNDFITGYCQSSKD